MLCAAPSALSSVLKDEFLRAAHGLVLAVRTADPTAWTAHPLFELRNNPGYMFFSLLGRLHKLYPTDPLIARQRSKTFP